jgi:hypothetical protein
VESYATRAGQDCLGPEGALGTVHWDALAAADFFTVEVLTVVGLVRYWVFFVMELKTRKVHDDNTFRIEGEGPPSGSAPST